MKRKKSARSSRHATDAENARFFAQVDSVLATLSEQVGKILLNGPLNEQQHIHLKFSLQVIWGMHDLFAREAARLGVATSQDPRRDN